MLAGPGLTGTARGRKALRWLTWLLPALGSGGLNWLLPTVRAGGLARLLPARRAGGLARLLPPLRAGGLTRLLPALRARRWSRRSPAALAAGRPTLARSRLPLTTRWVRPTLLAHRRLVPFDRSVRLLMC